MSLKLGFRLLFLFLLLAVLAVFSNAACQEDESSGLRFEIFFPEPAHSRPVTGRVYVMISDRRGGQPRLQLGTHGIPFFGKDIESLEPGDSVVIDKDVLGYPLESLMDIPPGEYTIQGFVNIYTEFKRSDGHAIWLHNDQWEGQRWNISPGNLFSDVQKIDLDPSESKTIEISCTNVIPPITIPPDTKWVKRVKFQSKILTEFWGRPMYLGATILLPKDYDEHPDVKYPVNYIQGHFSLAPPFGFMPPKTGGKKKRTGGVKNFSQLWVSENFPRMIFVTFQHPCPYYDDSYAVNSENCGPYGDAIMQELIPFVEEHFRIIRKSYARVLSGGSTGGWESLALQIFHPDFFGGTWSLCPDPVDFRFFQCVDIYRDENAFYKKFGWLRVPTPSDRQLDGIVRLTSQQRNHFELVMGNKNRSGEQVDIFEAVFGPVGPDGYVKPLFDKRTGVIDPQVAAHWKEHYDLRFILKRDWPVLGPKLAGKIHIYTGDMDTFYLDSAVRRLERFLEKTKDPYYAGVIGYGDRKPHCWGPSFTDLIKMMAGHITKNAPESENTSAWKHK